MWGAGVALGNHPRAVGDKYGGEGEERESFVLLSFRARLRSHGFFFVGPSRSHVSPYTFFPPRHVHVYYSDVMA